MNLRLGYHVLDSGVPLLALTLPFPTAWLFSAGHSPTILIDTRCSVASGHQEGRKAVLSQGLQLCRV